MPSPINRIAEIVIVVAVCSAAKCGGDSTATSVASRPSEFHDTTGSVIVVNPPSGTDPCLTRDKAEKALGVSLVADPIRVRSADTPVPSDQGSACLFELPPRGSISRHVVMQVALDESGTMQVAFEGMGKIEKEFQGDTAPVVGPWDYVDVIPGGLTVVRAGRLSMQLSSPPGEPEPAFALAEAVLDNLTEYPPSETPYDPQAIPRNSVPCMLLTRQEAEAVLGPLVIVPYASNRRTAILNTAGASCAYMGRHHRGLVLTPTLRHGAEFFRMKGGRNITELAKESAASSSASPTGSWDSLSVGGDGELHALKGDKVLSMQYLTSSAKLPGAIKLMRVAIARF